MGVWDKVVEGKGCDGTACEGRGRWVGLLTASGCGWGGQKGGDDKKETRVMLTGQMGKSKNDSMDGD